MYRFGKWIAEHRALVLLLAVVLLIPAIYGYVHVHVNYDILYYLPDDIETMQGQQILLDDFGKGAYAMFVAEGMTDGEVSRLKAEIEQVDHVADVIWYDSVMDVSVPAQILPEELYEKFHSEDATLMAIFFDTGTSDDATMDAIDEIRSIAGERCFLSSMSAIVTDTKHLVEQELFWYVLIAVAASALVLALTMDSWMAPVLFLLNIGMAIIYNLGRYPSSPCRWRRCCSSRSRWTTPFSCGTPIGNSEAIRRTRTTPWQRPSSRPSAQYPARR